MRKPLLLGLVLVLLVFLALEIEYFLPGKKTAFLRHQARAPAPAAAVPAPAVSAPIGEKIIYDVMLGKVRVGSAIFEYVGRSTLDQRPVDVFTFTTRAAKFTDYEKIYSDPETFLPLRVERDINGWSKKEKIVENYDQQAYTVSIKKRVGRKEETLLFKKKEAIHNAILLPSAVRRSQKFDPGWAFKANLPTQEFTITFAAMENIALPAGRFKAARFTSTPARFEIWISADEYKLPIKIKGVSGLGYILVLRRHVKPPDAS